MGWKAIKDHYGISATVCYDRHHPNTLNVRDGQAGLVLAVTRDLKIVESERGSPLAASLITVFEKDPALFAKLFDQEDVFATSIPIYWIADDGLSFTATACEKFEPRMVSHCGRMFLTLFGVTTDKSEATRTVSDNITMFEETCARCIAESEKALASAHAKLAELAQKRAKLAE